MVLRESGERVGRRGTAFAMGHMELYLPRRLRRAGRRLVPGLLRTSKTPKSTSLGTVLKAQTTRAFGSFFASASAPEEVWAMTNSVLSAFIGSEQVLIERIQ